jgi:biopolymer transport protein ExbD
MLRKKRSHEAAIPTSSMADIAFLLLIFFLVATVIDVDTGIGLTLPEYIPPGDVLLDGKPISLFQIKNTLKPRIQSKIGLPKNKKLIVSVKTDRKTRYNAYIQALDQIKLAYFEVRDEYSRSKFGAKFDDLNEDGQNEVKDAVPIIISLAEPEAVKK